MKTITKVVLRNYRSHENSTVEFGPLTSIIGENDQGKSNVYRALDMVLTNAAFSDAQLRYGTKEGSVKVFFSDGTWIERTRKGTKQTCVLFDGKKETVYDTIKDITGIVQDFTGFKPITIDKNSRPESVQLIPIDAGQTFLITGISPDGVMRRVNRLMSGAGVETARLALEKELRVIEKSNAVQEAEMNRQQAIVDVLDSSVWGEVREMFDATKDKLETLNRLEEGEAFLMEFGNLPQLCTHVWAAKDVFGKTLEDVYNTRPKIAKIKDLQAQIKQLQTWQATIDDAMPKLLALYDEDDAIQAEMAELKPQIDAAKEDEFKKRQAEQMAKQKVCPTCKRPL